MTLLKTLGVIVILTTAATAPGFAQDAGHGHSRIHTAHHQFRDAYNQGNDRYDLNLQSQRNIASWGVRGHDPSRIGGEDPDLHPSAY